MGTEDTQPVAEQVLDALSRCVIEVGQLLDEVFENDVQFATWVEDNLPLQPHTAERVRAMWHLHQFRGNHPDVPPAWQALWSLG